MVKKEFVELYCQEYGIEAREEGKKQVEMFLKLIEKAFIKNDTVIFRGLGTFSVKTVQKRNPVNPKTHEPVKTAPRVTVRFKCGKKLEEALTDARTKKTRGRRKTKEKKEVKEAKEVKETKVTETKKEKKK